MSNNQDVAPDSQPRAKSVCHPWRRPRQLRTAEAGDRVLSYWGAQDTFYVGTLKGVGRVYQQTFIDTYAKVAFA